MKKLKGVLLLLTLVIASARSFGQQQIYENVEVVNQEILVRVFSGGEPVSGLHAEDFRLYEDGRRVEITSCRQLRRTMAEKADLAKTALPEVRPWRFFLFMLWFNEESAEWPKAWKYFLSHIYRPGDRIILSDGMRAMEIFSPEKEKAKIAAFLEECRDAVKQRKLDKNRLVSEMENDASSFYDNLVAGVINPKLLLNDFKVRYLGALNEYRLARLKGYTPWLERLTASLKAVEAEKWVLVFLQNERLPLLDREGRLFMRAPAAIKAEMERFMEDSQRQISFSSDAIEYFRNLQPLFVGANATYHLFLSDAVGESLSGEHLQWKPVFSSWEGAFRMISADTGGRISNTTKLGAALEKVAASEDIYYVLTYQPSAEKDRKRDLRVEASSPGLKAVYSRKLTLTEIFPLKIAKLEWQEGMIKISLSDFQRMYGDSGLTGRLRVRVQAETKGEKILASEREILPFDPDVTVEMALNFPAFGRYRVQVDIEDLLSGNRAQAKKEIEILAPLPQIEKQKQEVCEEATPSPELAVLLERAAGYCRRLKEGAFRFYCLETVEEKALQRNPQNKQVETDERRWRYDYQIVGAGGEIKEQRRLLHKSSMKAGSESAPLETRFTSRYSVFMPVTLLAPENRVKYRYRLIKREKLKKKSCAVVEVLPRNQEIGDIAHGKVWMDEGDGSVLKIEMSPRGVAGIQALNEEARKMSAQLNLAVTHWYLVMHEGLRFPSETEFIESYEFAKSIARDVKTVRPETVLHRSQIQVAVGQPYLETRPRLVEFYRLRQGYKKYRFFQVDSREEIQNLE